MSSSPAKEQASLPSWSPYPMEATANAAISTEAVADVLRAPVSGAVPGAAPGPMPTAAAPVDAPPRISVAPPTGKPKPTKKAAAGRAPARQASTMQARAASSRRPVWVAGDADDALNGKQYVRELDRFSAVEGRKIAQDTLIDVRSDEIEGLARLAAVARGRYLAKLLDSGGSGRPTMQEAEVSELRRFRETYEEVREGLKILKEAIEAGEVKVGDGKG